MRCLEHSSSFTLPNIFQLTAIPKIYFRSRHKQSFVSLFMVRSLYVKITDVFHFQIDGIATCFTQKKVSITLETTNVGSAS